VEDDRHKVGPQKDDPQEEVPVMGLLVILVLFFVLLIVWELISPGSLYRTFAG
jgi:hypothetical protein